VGWSVVVRWGVGCQKEWIRWLSSTLKPESIIGRRGLSINLGILIPLFRRPNLDAFPPSAGPSSCPS